MKISAKTLNAATKVAAKYGISVDKWADQVLAEAAASAGRPSTIDAQLREISNKIDRLSERQRTGDQLTEFAAKARDFLDRARKSASDFVGPIVLPTDDATDAAAEPTKPSRRAARPSASRASKSSARGGRAANRKAKGSKPRGSQRRRSKQ